MPSSFAAQSVVVLLVAAFVVLRFAARELRPRIIKASTLWIRPALLVLFTGWVVWSTVMVDPEGTGFMVGALAVGAVAGVIVGVLVVRYTRFAPANVPNAVVASGSRITFAIWFIAFVLRFAARFVVPHGADARSQLPLNAGTLAVLAVAFIVIAFAFRNAIARYSRASVP